MKATKSAMLATLAGLALFAAPGLAQAAQGFIVDQTSLRAGPSWQFPTVDRLPAGIPVTVFGCVGGRSWCDVSFQGDRGWVSGQDLEIFFHNRRVRIVEVEPTFVPIETFEVSTYWPRYYRSKPFFAERDRFASINININSNSRTKSASGPTGKFGAVAVTGGAGNKMMQGRTGRGSANAHVFASANANAKLCPAGQKNCQIGKHNAGMNGMNGMNKATANGAATLSKEKTANAGNIGKGGAVTGSIGVKGSHNKKCQPGMPCAQGANGGNMGPNGGAAPAQ